MCVIHPADCSKTLLIVKRSERVLSLCHYMWEILTVEYSSAQKLFISLFTDASFFQSSFHSTSTYSLSASIIYSNTQSKSKSQSLLYCQFCHMYSTYIQRIEIALLSDPWCIQITLTVERKNTDKYKSNIYIYIYIHTHIECNYYNIQIRTCKK